jgi:hypothetical protein
VHRESCAQKGYKAQSHIHFLRGVALSLIGVDGGPSRAQGRGNRGSRHPMELLRPTKVGNEWPGANMQPPAGVEAEDIGVLTEPASVDGAEVDIVTGGLGVLPAVEVDIVTGGLGVLPAVEGDGRIPPTPSVIGGVLERNRQRRHGYGDVLQQLV